jgi:hypothetical protein
MLAAGAKPYTYSRLQKAEKEKPMMIEYLKNKSIMMHAGLLFRPMSERKKIWGMMNPYEIYFTKPYSQFYIR